ncbi:leukocyte elastase inhibitor A, putative [Entamoeba invadens IP1]|uniref:Leukocyte elastase inhibitor A, putative n=1 Tax=Entamoeba invadens IP1 TaxID=370355 RepID=A0A0A1U6A8_ENTIV|nr:leukocyte elastase inhibitor A, putative [Entamoeba invadens IP1]ELP89908.1 leukocyte elastase inhibitor A, putative [Entamoeba invadens IP1]|eukprot:XP_004256679.1 leukocyte elastase inhibitor A, putative [Entamoeba invadens IP1]
MSSEDTLDYSIVTPLQQALGKLCLDWFTTSRDKSDIVYSTHSMFLAFSLLYLGSQGATQKEISEVFGFSAIPADKLVGVLSNLVSPKYSKNTVEIVDAIWGSKFFTFVDEYTEKMTQLSCKISTADFEKEAENTRQEINAFVAQKTQNLIKDLIPSGVINATTVAVLVNAIYFKGIWREKFDILNDKHVFGNDQKVTMLSQKVYSRALFDKEYTSCSLTYQDNINQIVFVMPDDLENFEKTRINELYEIMKKTAEQYPEKRNVTFPKFSIESSFNMVSQLKTLGINLAFGDMADFSNMSTGGHFCVSDAIHRAVVKVDENGTEAAAATALMMCLCCGPMEPPRDVVIDKPFYFAILGRYKLPLFFGKITHPKF